MMLNILFLLTALQAPPVTKKLLPKTSVRDTTKTYIVIHNDGANLGAMTTRLVLRVRRLSYHYFIARSGKIYQFMDVTNIAKHAGVSEWDKEYLLNTISIGICLQGKDDMPYNDKQYESLSKIINYIHQRFPDSRDKQLLTHAEIAIPHGRKTDPGIFFDTTRLTLKKFSKEGE
jgi:N-acetyl-anhydromuramyl-L-alanine amidase AmpD